MRTEHYLIRQKFCYSKRIHPSYQKVRFQTSTLTVCVKLLPPNGQKYFLNVFYMLLRNFLYVNISLKYEKTNFFG